MKDKVRSSAQNNVQLALRRLRDELGSWRKVGSRLRMNPGYVWSVAGSKKKPSVALYKALGLTPPKRKIELEEGYDIAPCCPKCGRVHVAKRCTANQPRKPRSRPYRWNGRRFYRHQGTDQI